MKTKDLLGYITKVTHKSPKIYRFTFVNRMIDLCMDALTLFLEANEIHVTSGNWKKRGAERVDLQRKGISRLRTLAYFAEISQKSEVAVLTEKQYLQIAKRVDECIKFAQSWLKSEQRRMRQYLQPQEDEPGNIGVN